MLRSVKRFVLYDSVRYRDDLLRERENCFFLSDRTECIILNCNCSGKVIGLFIVWQCAKGSEGSFFAKRALRDCNQFDGNANATSAK